MKRLFGLLVICLILTSLAVFADLGVVPKPGFSLVVIEAGCSVSGNQSENCGGSCVHGYACGWVPPEYRVCKGNHPLPTERPTSGVVMKDGDEYRLNYLPNTPVDTQFEITKVSETTGLGPGKTIVEAYTLVGEDWVKVREIPLFVEPGQVYTFKEIIKESETIAGITTTIPEGTSREYYFFVLNDAFVVNVINPAPTPAPTLEPTAPSGSSSSDGRIINYYGITLDKVPISPEGFLSLVPPGKLAVYWGEVPEGVSGISYPLFMGKMVDGAMLTIFNSYAEFMKAIDKILLGESEKPKPKKYCWCSFKIECTGECKTDVTSNIPEESFVGSTPVFNRAAGKTIECKSSDITIQGGECGSDKECKQSCPSQSPNQEPFLAACSGITETACGGNYIGTTCFTVQGEHVCAEG